MTLARRPLLALATSTLLLGPLLARARDTVRGSGVAATQRRDLGPFTRVSLDAPFAVVLRPGSRDLIEIAADDNVLPLIETTLRADRSLQIELAKDVRIEPRTPVVVTIDLVRLDALALGGSGSISGKTIKTAGLDAAIGGSGSIALSELDVGDLAVSIGGSGVFRADGHARRLTVSVGGSGNCDTERLAAADVSVSIAGSGGARVRAENALRAAIAGSGDVYYSGAATPRISIAGTGRVKRI
jgi:hypothetical protein